MAMSKRKIKSISNKTGTVSKGEIVAKVRFSLSQWQEFIDDIPGMRSASGTIEFEKTAEASSFFESIGSATLRGGGIEAQILVLSLDQFRVTGPVTETAP
jgi:hypothetical protein